MNGKIGGIHTSACKAGNNHPVLAAIGIGSTKKDRFSLLQKLKEAV